ncbi:hypothetical protein H0H87_007627, partial [Tephrocybe sp. NHM501043]
MPTVDVPQIAITGDETGPDVDSAARTTVQTNLLSPHPQRSPTSTAVDSGDDSSSLNVPPPSPTLSTGSSIHSANSAHSVHFANSTDLRANDPEQVFGHARKPSFASATTVPDDHNDAFSREPSELGHSRVDSATTTLTSETNAKKDKKKRKKKEEEKDERTAHQIELDQDK